MTMEILLANKNLYKRLKIIAKNCSITIEEIIDRFYIKSLNVRNELEEIASNNNYVINEFHLKKFMLTPRHIDITFNGRFQVKIDYREAI